MASFVVRQIPNTITCCNLVSGCIAVLMAFRGHADYALWCIVAGAVFDFFDGFAARLLKVSSPIGKELDSLADVVTFGFAPAAILFSRIDSLPHLHETAWPMLAFLMAAFSALRLAKFNLDERQATSFIGLPTPANALFWASLCTTLPASVAQDSECALAIGLFALMALSCWLLVSEVPMFALKFKSFSLHDNKLRYLFLLSSVAVLAWLQVAGIAVVILWYIVLSLCTQRRQP